MYRVPDPSAREGTRLFALSKDPDTLVGPAPTSNRIIVTSPARTFLDGPRSLSVDIAERLIRRHQTNGPFGPRADLREVMVIVPGARSGRRLVDQLARAADALDLLLIPPRIHTPGSAIETFRLGSANERINE